MTCKTCDGSGSIYYGWEPKSECPACDGSGVDPTSFIPPPGRWELDEICGCAGAYVDPVTQSQIRPPNK